MGIIESWIGEITIWKIISLAVWIISVISGICGIIAYYKRPRGQKPKYMMTSAVFRREMIKNSAIEIRHGDKTLENFTVTKVVIWNAGNTIKRGDVATKNPLHVSVEEDSEILETQILYSEKQNDISLLPAEDKKSVKIDFEYLAKNEGVVLKVFHTGNNSKSISASCSLMSGKNLIKSEWSSLMKANRIASHLSKRTLAKLYGWMIILTCILTILEQTIEYWHFNPVKERSLTATIISVTLFVVLAIYAYRTMIRHRLPKKLEEYYYGEDY